MSQRNATDIRSIFDSWANKLEALRMANLELRLTLNQVITIAERSEATQPMDGNILYRAKELCREPIPETVKTTGLIGTGRKTKF